MRALYAQMSDGELLELAEKPDDLTEMALQVLRGEMTSRNLRLEPAGGGGTERRWASDVFADGGSRAKSSATAILGSGPRLDALEESEHPGESFLYVFYDAFKAGQACEALEAVEMWFRIEDVAKENTPVALRLSVRMQDHERAVAVMRRELGLFPLREVAEPDAMVDDGTVSQVAYFGSREEAEFAAEALQRRGIWNRVTTNPEGSVENEDAWVVEVKEMDLVRAGDVVIEAIRAAEG